MKEFEERCLTTVREIAKELDELAANPRDRELLEEQAEELELVIMDYEIIEEENGSLTEAEREELEKMQKELEAIRERLDNGKATDLYSYFEDALDITYYISGNGEYRGVAVTITTGGPHIEVDTNDMAVKLWWGGETAEWSISRNTAEAIDDIFCEYYQAIR